ncbi:phosphatidylglycerophosphatase A [Gottschalkia acidurici 9a]|uniref:Phosphatidylglycerophosphatase A n=1 Tax=Gottschalkia acidurici (strain ATCC 7906 / DSM 604 / BCRC 14475 / CIP 104303 / KCTC 5404 / NCIMB 10678 / 9a) TaxID=1128398 RepID=K0AZZ1_GOTA9|nr:phosphatidylglycerophosphatase A [Gottschalkia acidurici]AFS78849.1 phosphatidylglycerophosphatase A [Gottschalkia acidurici 9a]
MKEIVIKKLEDRGVTIDDIADLVIELQKDYIKISMEQAKNNIESVLSKREVQHAILTGIQIDELAEKNLLEEPLLSIVKRDEPLYGVDEILTLGITNIYGTIGLTNFGYLDKLKLGIVGEVDRIGKETDRVNTFLDDLICGIVAAACSKIAHGNYA